MAVAVEVGCDAAVAADGQVRRPSARLTFDELPVHVVEERAARQAAVRSASCGMFASEYELTTKRSIQPSLS